MLRLATKFVGIATTDVMVKQHNYFVGATTTPIHETTFTPILGQCMAIKSGDFQSNILPRG